MLGPIPSAVGAMLVRRLFSLIRLETISNSPDIALQEAEVNRHAAPEHS